MYENGNMSPADMAAVMNNNDNMGFGGGAWWWIIILFLFIFNGGYGGFNGGGYNNVENGVQRGFDQSAIMTGLGDINIGMTNGFAGVQNALCNGFAGVANGFSQAEIANNSRQMANMNQIYGLQTGISNQIYGLQNGLSTQLNVLAMNQQNSCAENRAAVADLKYTVATEACADRAAVSDAMNVLLNSVNAQVQSLKDQMCQDKIDAKNERIAELQNQLTLANFAASQNAQTAAIIANNDAQTNALEQYLAPVPRPAYVVQNPSCCANSFNGCGCMA